MVAVAPQPEKINQAVKYLQVLAERTDVSLGQLSMSILYGSKLFPLLVTLLLGVIAVSEATHIVSRSDLTFVPHPVFRFAYRIRWVFGLIAILATIAPSAIISCALQSLP